MGSAFAEVFPAAVGLALVNPLPVIAVIALLFSPRAAVTAPAFVVGWLLGLAVVLGILLFAVPTERLVGDAQDPSTFASILRLAIGLALLWLALGKWRGRPKAGEAGTLPSWMASLEQARPVAALGLGAALSGLNPKNLAFIVTVAVAISEAHLSVGASAALVALFVVIGSFGVAGPVVWYLLARDHARATLSVWRGWLTANYNTVMAVVFVLFGAVLCGKGIGGLIG